MLYACMVIVKISLSELCTARLALSVIALGTYFAEEATSCVDGKFGNRPMVVKGRHMSLSTCSCVYMPNGQRSLKVFLSFECSLHVVLLLELLSSNKSRSYFKL